MIVSSKGKNYIVFYRCLFGFLIIAWCALIFCMSNETAIESSERSTGLIRNFLGMIVRIIGGDSVDTELVDKLEFFVRKAAHMFLYFVLTILVFMFLSCYDIKMRSRAVCSLGFSFVYCSTDEIHQLFIEGRSGNFFDIAVDMIGALIGMTAVLIIFKIREKRRDKNTNPLKS